MFDALAHAYRFNNVILGMATQEFEAGDWAWRPEGGGNPAHWLLGHITYSRRAILQRLGEDTDPAALGDTFGRGTHPGATLQPDVDTLREEFLASGDRISRLLRTLTEEAAAAELGREMPDGSHTVGGFLHFMQLHETLHLGQMQYLGRCLGKAGIP